MNKNKLTALCHKIAKEKNISFNVAMTYYFLEVILSKIAASDFRDKFIFKGGFLLSHIIGLESRTTSDMDFIIYQLQMDENVLTSALTEILHDEDLTFSIGKMIEIKDEDPYWGYRITVICQFENIRQTIPLDIATGDPITPKSIQYSYKSLFSDTEYPIIAYNIETILAEKLETIYRRGFFNSRSKDFYDVYILYQTQGDRIDVDKLAQACKNTFAYRQTTFDLVDYLSLLEELKGSQQLTSYWRNYQKQYDYAKNITFDEVIQVCKTLITKIIGKN